MKHRVKEWQVTDCRLSLAIFIMESKSTIEEEVLGSRKSRTLSHILRSTPTNLQRELALHFDDYGKKFYAKVGTVQWSNWQSHQFPFPTKNPRTKPKQWRFAGFCCGWHPPLQRPSLAHWSSNICSHSSLFRVVQQRMLQERICATPTLFCNHNPQNPRFVDWPFSWPMWFGEPSRSDGRWCWKWWVWEKVPRDVVCGTQQSNNYGSRWHDEIGNIFWWSQLDHWKIDKFDMLQRHEQENIENNEKRSMDTISWFTRAQRESESTRNANTFWLDI